ncbi:hypothetical protein [Amycolatopsis taiwanensis]|uniref:Uncharacterized protein n=1 Tax=Amycolatopsis taiwanensis TaxID=342230 RepID=A0A9W6R1T1_9PSEU|nr:hypothetical protein [Amycolatopsis taiwanensis]GLY66092.1 hypothetical protein Atai01_27110 [Amycolatopsis taiwanensis]
MRLVRLGQQPSRVAEDIRAALASLGRGDHAVGGIALVGPRPLPTAKPVDAVVLMPHGVIIVLGVDLPDPAIKLEAPLAGQWKADGWPLVGRGSAAHPAASALSQASSICRQLRQTAPKSLPIGTIVAVGPFVETVEQPAADLTGTTRVLHPTPTTMLAATVSLASGDTPCTVDEVRALLRVLAPEVAQLGTEVLTAEGFADGPAEPGQDPLSAVTLTMPAVPAKPPAPAAQPRGPVTTETPPAPAPATPPAPPSTPPSAPAPATPSDAPPPKPIEVTAPVPKIRTPVAAPRNSRTVRWLPMAAIGLLAVIMVTAIVLATTRSGDSAQPAPSTAPRAQTVQGFQFLERASGTQQSCAEHAYGDLQASLQRAACTMMRRGSFETTVDGKPVAVSIAVVYFGDETAATAFKAVADTPGGGGVTDVATEAGKWSRTPQFAGAAYASAITGTAVRLVLTSWFDSASSASDPNLVEVAHLALSVQVS